MGNSLPRREMFLFPMTEFPRGNQGFSHVLQLGGGGGHYNRAGSREISVNCEGRPRWFTRYPSDLDVASPRSSFPFIILNRAFPSSSCKATRRMRLDFFLPNTCSSRESDRQAKRKEKKREPRGVSTFSREAERATENC